MSSGSSSGGTTSDTWLTTPTPANAMGQFPFPQDRRTTNGAYPTTISHLKIQKLYQAWLGTPSSGTSMVTTSGAPAGALRVQDPMTGDQTTSEGMAYGMLIAVYMSDKATFDAFWQYAQSHISNGLMSWQITSAGAPNGNGGVNSAADADEDMAWALIMADKQWPGGSYLTSAKSLLTNIKSQEINGSNNVKDGNFNNAASSHPDYAAPDYYKVFATVSGDSSWNAVYTAEYAQLTSAQNGSTGLIPDAIGGGTFGYDACRAPWRVGIDYIWNAAPSAKSFLTPMETYLINTVANGNVMNVKLTIPVGGGTGTDVTGAITGPAAVGAMYSASNQQFIDNSYNYLSTVVANATAGGAGLNYFSGTLGLLAMLTLAGDFVDYTNPPP